jgi:hypothetical protein
MWIRGTQRYGLTRDGRAIKIDVAAVKQSGGGLGAAFGADLARVRSSVAIINVARRIAAISRLPYSAGCPG